MLTRSRREPFVVTDDLHHQPEPGMGAIADGGTVALGDEAIESEDRHGRGKPPETWPVAL